MTVFVEIAPYPCIYPCIYTIIYTIIYPYIYPYIYLVYVPPLHFLFALTPLTYIIIYVCPSSFTFMFAFTPLSHSPINIYPSIFINVYISPLHLSFCVYPSIFPPLRLPLYTYRFLQNFPKFLMLWDTFRDKYEDISPLSTSLILVFFPKCIPER